MILYSSSSSPCLSLYSSLSYPYNPIISIKYTFCKAQAKAVKHAKTPSNSDSLHTTNKQNDKKFKFLEVGCKNFCSCGRRGFIGATFLPLLENPSYAALDPYPSADPMFMIRLRWKANEQVPLAFPGRESQSSCKIHEKFVPSSLTSMLNRIHPPRPDWYEEFYASAMNSTMESYEVEIAGYKSQIFSNLRKNSNRILELGIGTGPNLKYYASNGVEVVGVDPNQKMEKYAKAAAVSTGLPPEKFKFIRAVGEALPIDDASIDAVVGTLVLCSVKDVDATLQEVRRVLKPGGLYLFVEHIAAEDGTILKFVQGILDPLQQTVADGCHLSRNTGESISAAGFSSVDMNMVYLSALSLIGPHVYGTARK